MTQHYIGTKIVLAYNMTKDGEPGYGITYPDGYSSWSPKKTFEEAYLAMGNVGHLPAYQQRLIGEEVQLRSMTEKLSNFIGSEVFHSLPNVEKAALTHQHGIMRQYLDVLQDRINRIPR